MKEYAAAQTALLYTCSAFRYWMHQFAHASCLYSLLLPTAEEKSSQFKSEYVYQRASISRASLFASHRHLKLRTFLLQAVELPRTISSKGHTTISDWEAREAQDNRMAWFYRPYQSYLRKACIRHLTNTILWGTSRFSDQILLNRPQVKTCHTSCSKLGLHRLQLGAITVMWFTLSTSGFIPNVGEETPPTPVERTEPAIT